VLEPIANRPGTWDSLRVGVFRVDPAAGSDRELAESAQQIGEYVRNYRSLYETFYPFQGTDGSWYALYSPDYTSTRVLRLPDCVDIGGEPSAGGGFCPVAFYVPRYREGWVAADDGARLPYVVTANDLPAGQRFDTYEYDCDALGPVRGFPFGFVAGCHWGDDWSWKVQLLDLRQAHRGLVGREAAALGYLALPDDLTLAECVHLEGDTPDAQRLTLAVRRSFALDLPGDRATAPIRVRGSDIGG
jgi:hypothetical protein